MRSSPISRPSSLLKTVQSGLRAVDDFSRAVWNHSRLDTLCTQTGAAEKESIVGGGFYSAVQGTELKRRFFPCTPFWLEPQDRTGILINAGGAKCEYQYGAKSGCQTQDDIAKFLANEQELVALFGDLKIQRWKLVVPCWMDKELLKHAKTKEQFVRKAKPTHAAENFEISRY